MKYNNKNKYYNCPTRSSDGIIHDSMREANRWEQLLLLQRGNAIADLQRQVKYVLIPMQYETFERYGKDGNRLKDGKRLAERECAYIADFVYTDVASGQTIVEDVKGVRTDVYKIKKKLMLWIHGIKIIET